MIKDKVNLIKYGLKYKVYTPLDVIKTILTKFLPNKLKKYPIYSIYRMKKEYFDEENKRFDFNGIFLPDIPLSYLLCLGTIYIDQFHIFCRFEDDYKHINYYEYDKMCEGSYPFVDCDKIIGIEKGDVVIDAGAWIGDFSAYAAKKGASKVFAFEPQKENYKYLEITAQLNSENVIVPVLKGLGETNKDIGMSGTNETAQIDENSEQKINITTIDEFVNESNINRVNFIKADIEGYERFMLKGAVETLKKFGPKLSICTYHLKDDPEILERIILEANPKYKVIQRRKKLFAYIGE